MKLNDAAALQEQSLYEVRKKIYPRAVHGAFAAWRWTLDSLDRFYDATPMDGAGPPAEDTHGGYLALIRTLPEAYRETLVLRLSEGLTGPEIAQRTGLTPASVRVNLHRGMKLLREKLQG